MQDEAYQPRDYWSALVEGTGSLANVGQPALGRAYNCWAYRFRLRALERALRGTDLPASRLFEAAYGEGFYLAYWKARGVRQVAGVDISQAAWEAAKERFPGFDLRHGDLTQPDVFDGLGRFDVVTAIDVLYHITDDDKWAAALGHVADLVDERGILVTTDKYPLREIHQRFPHVRRRPLSMWNEALAARGLEVRSITPVFVLMDDPITVGHHPWLGRLSSLQWRILTRPLKALSARPAFQDRLGSLVAACQYLPERALVGMLDRVPSTEIVVYERTGLVAQA